MIESTSAECHFFTQLCVRDLICVCHTPNDSFTFTWNDRPMSSLVFVEQGSLEFTTSSSIVCCKCGELVYIPRGLSYHVKGRGDTIRFYTMDFSFEMKVVSIEKIHYDVRLKANHVLYPSITILDLSRDIVSLHVKRIITLYYSRNIYENIMATAHFYIVWSSIIKKIETTKGSIPQQIKLYLEENPLKPFSPTDICYHLHISKSTLFASFKNEYGISPMKYHHQLLFSIIAEYMAGGCYTIAEICDLFGFSSEKYFAKTFKEYMGVSPSMYLKIHTNN